MKEYLLVGGPRDGERRKANSFSRRYNIAFESQIIRYKPVAWAHSDSHGGIVLLEENIPDDQLIPMLISGYRQPKYPEGKPKEKPCELREGIRNDRNHDC